MPALSKAAQPLITGKVKETEKLKFLNRFAFGLCKKTGFIFDEESFLSPS